MSLKEDQKTKSFKDTLKLKLQKDFPGAEIDFLNQDGLIVFLLMQINEKLEKLIKK